MIDKRYPILKEFRRFLLVTAGVTPCARPLLPKSAPGPAPLPLNLGFQFSPWSFDHINLALFYEWGMKIITKNDIFYFKNLKTSTENLP